MIIFFKNKLYLFKSMSLLFLNSFFNIFFFNFSSLFFKKLYIKGLGYRSFLYTSHLFLLFGMSHYYKITIPTTLVVYKKKNNLFLISKNYSQLSNFADKITLLRPLSFYKEKGVLKNVDWSLFIKKRVTLQK